MTDKTKHYLSMGIGCLFLIYGAVRFGVSCLLILQSKGVLADSELQAGLDEVAQFLTLMQEQALVPMSALGYLGYLWVMGALLILGAIGCLSRKHALKSSLYVFLILYCALFINFQTINPKVLHLIVCAGLLLFYNYLVKPSPLEIQKE